MKGPGRAIALAALVASALVSPLGGHAFGRACAAGTVHVAVIVDLGSGSSVSAVCVPVGSSSNGAAILAARASMLGTTQPRYSGSGLLCAIDGVPSTGCGVAHDGKYAYWSYWHGKSGSWSYSNVGPGSSSADAGVVEGWRWQPDGAGRPTDPAPRGPANASAICVPQSPPTAAPPPVTNARNTVTTASASAPITAASAGPTPGGGVPVTGTTTPGKPSGPTGSKAPKPKAKGPAATTAGEDRATTTAAGGSSTTVELVPRGIAAPPGPHSSDGLPIGPIVGVALVVALGGAGAVATRRRSRAPS